MLMNMLIGCGLVIVTTLIHALAMVFGLSTLRLGVVQRWAAGSAAMKAMSVATLALVMLVASAIESGAWAATYLLLGALQDVEEAVYFSMVTYTTLGYGDVVLDEQWRLLSSFEAANGIIMFGWTTAMIFAAVHVLYLRKDEAHAALLGGI